MYNTKYPLISVIVPVYNVEKYLSQCLESIINQTYKNIEIICINDASTDSSLNILKEYVQKDSRVKIIENEKNIGLGLTRNRGLELAHGKYIHFVDSDDWIKTDLYEDMQKIIEKNSPQIISFSFIFYDESIGKTCGNYSYNILENLYNKIFNPSNYPEIFDNNETVWKHLYKKDFLRDNKIKFTSLKCHEDTPFFIETLLKADKVFFIDEPFYYYRTRRKNSIIDLKFKYFDCYFDWFDIISNLVINEDEKIKIIIVKLIYCVLWENYRLLIVKDLFTAMKYWSKMKIYMQLDTFDEFMLPEISMQKNVLNKSSMIYYFIKAYINYYCPFLFEFIIKLKKLSNKKSES